MNTENENAKVIDMMKNLSFAIIDLLKISPNPIEADVAALDLVLHSVRGAKGYDPGHEKLFLSLLLEEEEVES